MMSLTELQHGKLVCEGKVYNSNTVTGRIDIWKYFSVVDSRKYPLNIKLLNRTWYQIHLPILQYQNFTTSFFIQTISPHFNKIIRTKMTATLDATNLTFYHKHLQFHPFKLVANSTTKFKLCKKYEEHIYIDIYILHRK